MTTITINSYAIGASVVMVDLISEGNEIELAIDKNQFESWLPEGKRLMSGCEYRGYKRGRNRFIPLDYWDLCDLNMIHQDLHNFITQIKLNLNNNDISSSNPCGRELNGDRIKERLIDYQQQSHSVY